MRGALRRSLWGLGLLAIFAIGAGTHLAVSAGTSYAGYVTPSLVPIDSTGEQPPLDLPAAVILPVPYTPQAPLGNWAARQHTCEEASLVMVDRYLRGDRSASLIDPQTADADINQVTAVKPAQDLDPRQVGQLAQRYMGWAYEVRPASRVEMKQQLALGRPLIVGVRTHGLGNREYPGYSTHHEEPGWSVSHYLVVTGYDRNDAYILNDPGLMRGHGYHVSYDQLMHAVDDLDRAYPDLSMGRVFLVVAPRG